MRVAIFGLGLVGGSLGLALKGRGVHVTGIELGELVGHAAVRAVADEVIDSKNDDAVRAAYAGADLCVLAAPVNAIVSEIPRAIASAPAVTDAGSTKRVIAAAAKEAAHFVPGHPMAGGSESGAEHARGDLFRRRPWILCPDGRAPLAIETTEAMLTLVGAEPVRLSAEEHDRSVAFTSHAPQLLASLLVVIAERRGNTSTAGAGFWAMTQAAGGNPAIWRDILATNADFIADALRELGSELASIATDAAVGLAIIEEARRLRGGANRGSR
jgi:prephenate dehydrogenase